MGWHRGRGQLGRKTPKPHKGPTSYRSPKGTGEVWVGWGRHQLGGIDSPPHTQLVALAKAGHRRCSINVI